MTNTKSFTDVRIGDPFARLEAGKIVGLYSAGQTLSEADHALLYPNKPYQKTVFQGDYAILSYPDGAHISVSSRVLARMATAHDYAAAAMAPNFKFPVDWTGKTKGEDTSIEYVSRTKLIELVRDQSGPCAVIYRKQPDFPIKSKANKVFEDFMKLDYEAKRDFMAGPIRVLFGQKPTNETAALSAAMHGTSYRNQTENTTRADAGYIYMVDYTQPFGGRGNTRQVNMDTLLGFVNTSEKKVYIMQSTSKKVTKEGQNRIIDQLQQGIAALG